MGEGEWTPEAPQQLPRGLERLTSQHTACPGAGVGVGGGCSLHSARTHRPAPLPTSPTASHPGAHRACFGCCTGHPHNPGLHDREVSAFSATPCGPASSAPLPGLRVGLLWWPPDRGRAGRGGRSPRPPNKLASTGRGCLHPLTASLPASSPALPALRASGQETTAAGSRSQERSAGCPCRRPEPLEQHPAPWPWPTGPACSQMPMCEDVRGPVPLQPSHPLPSAAAAKRWGEGNRRSR